MSDRPELVELVGDVILHVQAVAGDIPAASVLGSQGDAERGDERLHLLGDDRRRFVERLALKRNVVDEYIRIEHAVTAVERLLDIHEPASGLYADDQQHDGDDGAERADDRPANLACAAFPRLFAHRAFFRGLFCGRLSDRGFYFFRLLVGAPLGSGSLGG